MTDTIEARPRTRRSLLAAAAGGATALAAAAMGPTAARAASTNMLTEVDNVTEEPTSITNLVSGEGAFLARAAGAGTAIETTTGSGMGVVGVSHDTTDPSTNTRNAGVVGVAGDLNSIADNIGLSGVYGYSDPSPSDGFVAAGVWGQSPDIGVIGDGGTGVLGDGVWGVLGVTATPSTGIGVHAISDVATGRALRVQGRAEFTRSGRATIAAGTSSKKVTLAGCTTSTLVLAVLAANRSGRWVRAVVPVSGAFTIYLNTSVSVSTAVTWIAFTNPSNHSG